MCVNGELLSAGLARMGAYRWERRLPRSAREVSRSTIRLIGRGGPYPYERDGTVFHNYEKQLPLRGTGYYREYTVSTPGARGRGARRIVAGRDGELYYTDDHYRTFRRVLVETVKGGR